MQKEWTARLIGPLGLGAEEKGNLGKVENLGEQDSIRSHNVNSQVIQSKQNPVFYNCHTWMVLLCGLLIAMQFLKALKSESLDPQVGKATFNLSLICP